MKRRPIILNEIIIIILSQTYQLLSLLYLYTLFFVFSSAPWDNNSAMHAAVFF